MIKQELHIFRYKDLSIEYTYKQDDINTELRNHYLEDGDMWLDLLEADKFDEYFKD